MSRRYSVEVIDEKNQVEVIDDCTIEVISAGIQGPPGAAGTTNPVPFDVAYAANITINWSVGDIAELILTGDTTIAMTGTRRKGLMIIEQGTGAPWTVTWDPATVSFGDDIPALDLSSTEGKKDYIGFAYNDNSGKFDLIAFARGYA